jgi:hypothetical protein
MGSMTANVPEDTFTSTQPLPRPTETAVGMLAYAYYSKPTAVPMGD